MRDLNPARPHDAKIAMIDRLNIASKCHKSSKTVSSSAQGKMT